MTLVRATFAAIALLAVMVCPAAGDAKVAAKNRSKSSTKTHTVEAGQTLWVIARAHGCTVDQLVAANDLDSDGVIRPGQKLKIPRCSGTPSKQTAVATVMVHLVSKGDTLSKIAKQYDTSIEEIKRRNRLTNDTIRPGQELRISIGSDGSGRPIPGQSIGEPWQGRLENPLQLPSGKGYYRRRPYRSWGANHLVYHIQRLVKIVRGKHPKVHVLSIGDLSAKRGGLLEPHRSHQSGRDVDLGYFFTKKPKDYPKNFHKVTAKNLDYAATFTMLKTLCDTAGTAGGVTHIFVDYYIQKLLYEWAKEHKVPRRTLDKMFQYPHGPSSASGLIHDDPGHDDHFHVRFDCPPKDKNCRN